MSLRTIPYWLFMLLLLVAIQAIWRGDVLIQPPYWSAALGVFTQASSIAFGDVDANSTPAPATYRYSLVPRLLALLMGQVPLGTPLVLTFRILSFAMAATVVLAVVAHLYRRCGWGSAILTGLAMLTLPLFAVQAESMSEQIFMVAAVALASLAFQNRNFLLASLLGTLAFYLHFLAICYLLASSLLLLSRLVQSSSARSITGLFAHFIGLGIASVPIIWTGGEGWVASHEFGTSPASEIIRWSPDLLILAVVALLSMLAFARPKETSSASNIADSPLPLSSLLIIFLVSILAVTGAVPALFVLAAPFVLIALSWSLHSHPSLRPLGQAILYATIAVNLVNTNGVLFPPIADKDSDDLRTGSLRERSREYLAADHALNVDAVRSVIERCQGRKLVTAPPFTHFLALPALGYAITPWEGYSVRPTGLSRFKPVESIRDDEFQPLAIISVKNRYTSALDPPLPSPIPADHPVFPRDPAVFEQPRFKTSPLYVFVPRETPSDPPEEAKRRYLRRLWPDELLLTEAQDFIRMGNLRDAEPLLVKLLQAVPKHHSARLELGSLYEQQNRFDEAIAQYNLIPPGSADYWRAESQIAQILTAQEKFDQAQTHHEASLAACRKRAGYKPAEGAQILIRWATNDLGRKQYASARAKLREAIELMPNYSVPYRELGFVLYQELRQQEAIANLDRAAKLNPDDPVTYRYMGATWAVLGDWSKAADAFRKALLLYPSDAESLDGLITVLLKLGRYDEVILEVEDAIASRPDDTLHVPFLLGLGEALTKRAEWERAIATFRRALDLAPDSLDAVNQLAWTLATAPDDRFRNGPEATEIARALEKDESNSIYLDTVAAVRAENGLWDEAIEWEQKAITAAQKASQPARVQEFRQRLANYKQKQPYRTLAPSAPSK